MHLRKRLALCGLLGVVAFGLFYLKCPSVFGVTSFGVGRSDVHPRLLRLADRLAMQGLANLGSDQHGRAAAYLGASLLVMPVEEVTEHRREAFSGLLRQTISKL